MITIHRRLCPGPRAGAEAARAREHCGHGTERSGGKRRSGRLYYIIILYVEQREPEDIICYLYYIMLLYIGSGAEQREATQWTARQGTEAQSTVQSNTERGSIIGSSPMV